MQWQWQEFLNLLTQQAHSVLFELQLFFSVLGVVGGEQLTSFPRLLWLNLPQLRSTTVPAKSASKDSFPQPHSFSVISLSTGVIAVLPLPPTTLSSFKG